VCSVKQKPKGLDARWVPGLIRAMSRAHVWVYRRTGGRIGRRWRLGAAFPRGIPVCLLTTRGRRSGQPRTAPLVYLADGDRAVVVASQGGLARHPQWYLNLCAHPEVTVLTGARVMTMRARTATAQERAELWPRLVALYADYDSYQSWTEREIPVVVLDPVTPTSDT
jgi:F420H(2)-dependent quinone reductase